MRHADKDLSIADQLEGVRSVSASLRSTGTICSVTQVQTTCYLMEAVLPQP